ncbi:bifunctional DNA primase/polymerase [Actinokineospora diospyrosa]|uniref:Bifunctional DNA primase/polymerase, N-terminal n=1 Tax=Actinokineospora diospyrosa TaxID=103728 RepID=A0ABT1I6C4_9PSEU|nr:bifunctional DNA primase/polymerase [Actinokineospora diospyrosa]MCP2268182.1 Bifunctional DNA primase/polymerase, N-terminal [Actinokineospora diospyrosa]
MNGHADSLLTAALDAAARGWHVFPLRAGSKIPALHGHRGCPRTGPCRDGHRGWEQRATTDPDRICAAWSIRPFNIGVATGPSGLVVVDLDVPKAAGETAPDGWNQAGITDGADVFAAVCTDLGHPVPWDTLTVRTPSGGTHLYFAAPAGIELRNTEGTTGTGLGWKVDTRAHGGYVVGPGSTTPAGIYRLIEDTTVAPLPNWLTTRLTPPPPPVPATAAPTPGSTRLPAYVDAAVRGECDHVTAAQPGNHGKTLFAAAVVLGGLVGAGALPLAQAENALHTAAAHMITGKCTCTDREVRRTITNGLRAGTTRPRTLPTTGQAQSALWGGGAAA